ncbi:MAG: polysaccharide biosynthesis tyrosine autokinase [Verrucomicrobia bacterium]|nr:polysaccharide biosynthesis tyrosine autokinase [Verrucomicrobiota bacterium]
MPALLPAAGVKNPAAAQNLLNRLHRYRRVFLKRWWVFALCVATAIAVQAYLVSIKPPTFQSNAKILIGGSVQLSTSAAGVRDPQLEFVGTLVELIRSGEVRRRANERLLTLHPEMKASPVSLDVNKAAGALILLCTATGTDQTYTSRFLRAVTDEFVAYRKDLRSTKADMTVTKLADQIAQMERQISVIDQELVEFQKKQNVVVAEFEGNSLAKDVVKKKLELSTIKSEYDVIGLLTPEQQIERLDALDRRVAAVDKEGAGKVDSLAGKSEYQSALQQIALLKAERDDLSRFLKPKHPKIINLNDEITKNERIIANLREQSMGQINSRREALRRQIEKLEVDVKDAEAKALELQAVMAEFTRLKDSKDRLVAQQRQYQANLQDVKVNTEVEQDMVTVIEQATPAFEIPSGVLKAMAIAVAAGLLLGLTILVLLDRMDDRINSLAEFQSYFAEPILGQIPSDPSGRMDEFLKADETRPMMAESFRNIRSSLLYMPMEGARPRTLLVTSAVPNEGKSTIATNLALVLAYAGIKTLLIDADLRRGRIASTFSMPNEPGFADVLGGALPWREAIRKTPVENFHLMPRGRIIQQPSEYLLSARTDQFLRDVYPEFEYIIFDTAPVLAADDTASLAPKMDAVLFVVRLAHTSAKMSRNSLEILYKRQANVPGLILNAVDTSSPEFVYYRYPEYYYQIPSAERKAAKAAAAAEPAAKA